MNPRAIKNDVKNMATGNMKSALVTAGAFAIVYFVVRAWERAIGK